MHFVRWRNRVARRFEPCWDSIVVALFSAGFRCRLAVLPAISSLSVARLLVVVTTGPLRAQTVAASVDVNSTIAVMPEYGMGIHTSVYDNSLRAQGSPVFELLPDLLDQAGVDVLCYPGGGMDIRDSVGIT